jgi:hypothetical protein
MLLPNGLSIHLVTMTNEDQSDADDDQSGVDEDQSGADQILSMIIRPTDLTESSSYTDELDVLFKRQLISLRSLMFCRFCLNLTLMDKIEKLGLGFLCLNDCPIKVDNLDFRNRFGGLRTLHIVLHNSASGPMFFPKHLRRLTICGPDESRITFKPLSNIGVDLTDCDSLRKL